MFLKKIVYKMKLLGDFLQGESVDLNTTTVQEIRSKDAEVNNEIENAAAEFKGRGNDRDGR